MATSVVLVVWNQLGLTRACLESLRSTTTPFDLCVVDNGIFHGYDRDVSFAVREAGWRCAVVNAPFAHHGGGTRTAAAPFRSEEDLAQREAARRRFAAKWRHRLPNDVRRLGERLREWCRPRRTCAS